MFSYLDSWNLFCPEFASGHICTDGQVGMTETDPCYCLTIAPSISQQYKQANIN